MAAKRAKKTKRKAKAKRRAVVKIRRAKPAKRSAKAKLGNRAKAPARKTKARAKKTPRATRKDVLGEGNYTATRAFDKEQTDFVKKNRASIPQMGKEAERALEGPQGDELREAEAEAKSHAHTQEAAE